ncbi:hypothetical protein V6N11_018336 [Hibiscus sabdariffa]|uniref:Uncharacterized protein n=1 Tax=Hibiscus sabdariffa TaxID=183260 RepID=A0ABR2T727_9ROSI
MNSPFLSSSSGQYPAAGGRTKMADQNDDPVAIRIGKGCTRDNLKSITEIKHLLGLINDCWHPSEAEMVAYREKTKRIEWSFMHCATELQEAGIRFEKAEGNSIFSI